MAKSKNPSSYPAAYALLVQHFTSPLAAEVRQVFPLRADAEAQRFNFYSYKKALHCAKDSAAITADSIMARVIDLPEGDTALVFSLRDNAGAALDLEAAIAEAQRNTSPPPKAQSPDRFGEATTPPQAPTHSSDSVVDAYLKG